MVLILFRGRLHDGVHAQQPRIKSLDDAFDHSAFARGIGSFKDDDH
jgi:hypothetical protein